MIEEQEFEPMTWQEVQDNNGRWLRDNLSEGEASQMLSNAGDGGGLLEWAEEVLKGI